VALVFDRGLWMVAGVAIGGAAEDVLRPILEPAAQTAWANRPFKVLDPGTAAMLRARNHQPGYGGIDLQGVDLTDDARRGGLGTARFYLETEAARTWPGVAQLVNLRRRRLAFGGDSGIGQDEFRNALRRQGFRTEAIDYLTDLLVEHLDVADIANAIQQGFVPNDGILPTPTPPAPEWQHSDGAFTIPVEQVPIDPTSEAAFHGLDPQHLKVLAELVGLPPGEEALLDMWRRGIIDGTGYAAGLREGHTKTKWTAALSARFFQLLNPSVLVNLRLRGYIEDGEYHQRMRLHGYRAEQANDWFLSAGRPLAPQQMLDLIARKGPGPGGGVFDFADFRQGMVESDIKPKYATPAQALYHKYPPLFQLRRAVESGGMTKERAREVMHIERYEPQDITSLLASWHVDTGTARDPHVVKAETQLWTTQHTSYKAGESDAAEVETTLDLLNVPQGNHARILALWDRELELVRKQLTPTQLKKAWKGSTANPATGAPWTRDEAIARLERMGYSAADAETFLDE
jgi:hypothetical protein